MPKAGDLLKSTACVTIEPARQSFRAITEAVKLVPKADISQTDILNHRPSIKSFKIQVGESTC